MKSQQDAYKCQGNEDVDAEYDANHHKANFIRHFQSCQSNNDLYEDQQAQKEERTHEPEEILIVPLANTSSNPGTVVVEPLHADIAIVAVRSSGRPVDIASIAELNAKIMRFDGQGVYLLHVSHHTVLVFVIQGNLPQLLIFITGKNFRNHARVSEAQNDEGGLHHDVEDHRDGHESGRRLESRNGVVEDHSPPEEKMRTCVLLGLRDEKAEAVLVGVVVRHV